MQSFLKNNFLLILIVILAAFLRFFQLGQNPPSLEWDEVNHGYNAYSLIKTGKDEYGKSFPLYFRSFDDYKPPFYTYATVVPVAIFGLNDFAVRFTSALLGTLTVFFTYLLVSLIFKKKEIALLSALFLAISPWHIQFSRAAFESNCAVFWQVLSAWAFLAGVNSRGYKITLWFVLSAIAFGINLFVYHSARIFVPLFALLLIFLYKDFLLRNKKFLVGPTVVGVLFLALLLPIFFSTAGRLRFEGTSIFAKDKPVERSGTHIVQDIDTPFFNLGKVVHNKNVFYGFQIFENYISHFDPVYLFFTSDHLNRHRVPEMGLLYWWDIPFVILGFYFLLKSRFDSKIKMIIIGWFLLAPVAASVTRDVPHALRSEFFLPIYQVVIALGFYNYWQNYLIKKRFFVVSCVLLIINFGFFLHQYFVHLPIEYSKDWKYGRREAVLFSNAQKVNYDRVIVSTELEQPHAFWLYYLKYDPKMYLVQGGTISGGFGETGNKFDKFQFIPIDYRNQQKEKKTLFVGLPIEFPKDAEISKTVYYLNGEPAILVAK